MKFCEQCHVQVTGEQELCPLCQRILKGEASPSPFPVIPSFSHKYSLFLKIALFLSVISAVTCVTVNWIMPQRIWWSLFVLAGLGSMWISLLTAIRRRFNLSKNILWQMVLFSILSFLWDAGTGWRG
jgi:hypothetical protein